MTITSIIVAVAENGVIGNRDKIPWRLPVDLEHFSSLTKYHAVSMGRKTYESIIAILGKPLPERLSIVVTRQENYSISNKEGREGRVVHSWDEALACAKMFKNMYAHKLIREIFVIGGAEIYALALPHANRIYITDVHAKVDGDTFFPVLNPLEWEDAIIPTTHLKDEKNEYDCTFRMLEKGKNDS